MKTIILNASPRKNWNTAKMLKSAMEGVRDAGSEVEYIDLYDLNFTGCRSCLACKRKGAEPNKCYWKDDLSPLIDRILAADNLIIGSPIYLNDTTSQLHALLERLEFVTLSYGGNFTTFQGKVNVGIVLTMNATENFFRQNLLPYLQPQIQRFQRLHGKVEILGSFDTMQVADYSKYDMSMWDEDHKIKRNKEQFPIDLKNAYELGKRLGVKKDELI